MTEQFDRLKACTVEEGDGRDVIDFFEWTYLEFCEHLAEKVQKDLHDDAKYAFGYLRGAADAVNMTPIELLDEEGLV